MAPARTSLEICWLILVSAEAGENEWVMWQEVMERC